MALHSLIVNFSVSYRRLGQLACGLMVDGVNEEVFRAAPSAHVLIWFVSINQIAVRGFLQRRVIYD
jgi:hypothetical protein